MQAILNTKLALQLSDLMDETEGFYAPQELLVKQSI